MISLRFGVSAVLIAAALAGCITYFVTPAPPQPVGADQLLPPTVPNATSRSDWRDSTNTPPPSAENHIEAFQRAVEAILKNAKASAREPLITGPIPLPKRRPILRP
jgi:hypothetical protein